MAIHGGECDRKVDIDFSVNLNPLKTPQKVTDAIMQGVSRADCYPEYYQTAIRSELAKMEGISPDKVIAGNGASELLMAVVKAVNPKKAIIVEPGFYGYRHALNSLEKCEIQEFILTEDTEYRITERLVDIIHEDTDLLFLTNPCNPLGYNIDDLLLKRLLNKAKECKCAVLLDESFLLLSKDYSKVNITHTNGLIYNYPNLFIIRSFTKVMAIPGIRIGYIMSTKENIDRISKQLGEWNLSQVADYAGRASAQVIMETDFITKSNDYVNQESEYLTTELQKRDFRVFESDTVYITLKTEIDLFNRLLDKGILIRDCSNFTGLEKGFYRIAVRDHNSNVKLIEAIDEIRTC